MAANFEKFKKTRKYPTSSQKALHDLNKILSLLQPNVHPEIRKKLIKKITPKMIKQIGNDNSSLFKFFETPIYSELSENQRNALNEVVKLPNYIRHIKYLDFLKYVNPSKITPEMINGMNVEQIYVLCESEYMLSNLSYESIMKILEISKDTKILTKTHIKNINNRLLQLEDERLLQLETSLNINNISHWTRENIDMVFKKKANKYLTGEKAKQFYKRIRELNMDIKKPFIFEPPISNPISANDDYSMNNFNVNTDSSLVPAPLVSANDNYSMNEFNVNTNSSLIPAPLIPAPLIPAPSNSSSTHNDENNIQHKIQRNLLNNINAFTRPPPHPSKLFTRPSHSSKPLTGSMTQHKKRPTPVFKGGKKKYHTKKQRTRYA